MSSTSSSSRALRLQRLAQFKRLNPKSTRIKLNDHSSPKPSSTSETNPILLSSFKINKPSKTKNLKTNRKKSSKIFSLTANPINDMQESSSSALLSSTNSPPTSDAFINEIDQIDNENLNFKSYVANLNQQVNRDILKEDQHTKRVEKIIANENRKNIVNNASNSSGKTYTVIRKSETTDVIVNDNELEQFGQENISFEDVDQFIQDSSTPILLAKSKKRNIPKVYHSEIHYKPFRRNFWKSPPELSNLTREQVERRRWKLDNIKVRGSDCPPPIETWAQAGLPHTILKVIEDNKYHHLTPVQSQAIPIILSGRDIIACAQTGSGKTLAYLIPLFRHVLEREASEGFAPTFRMKNKKREHSVAQYKTKYRGSAGGFFALILTPIRELATQIYIEANKFISALNLQMVCAYGGSPLKNQIPLLKNGVHIVIATPGRFIALMRLNGGRITDMSKCSFVILDEADRMFDMGFTPQIEAILSNIRPDRQTIMCSATFPQRIHGLAKQILRNPIELVIGGRRNAANKNIVQHVEVLEEHEKFNRLLEILGQHQKHQSLVFVKSKTKVDQMFEVLIRRGYLCLPIHSGMEQADRDSTIADFKKGLISVLIASSVVARGLDCPSCAVVVNYDTPEHLQAYIHSIGRTGRAGKMGTSYTFISPEQERFAPFLVFALKKNKLTPPERLVQLAEIFEAKRASGLVRAAGDGFGGTGILNSESSSDAKFQAKKIQKMIAAGISVDETRAIQAQELLEGNTVVADSEEGNPSSTAKHTSSALEQAKLKALELMALSTNNVKSDSKPLFDDDDEEEGDSTSTTPQKFVSQLDINNIPMIVRRDITRKGALDDVEEFTNVSIRSKGHYIPPGTKPDPNKKPIHLLIQGSTKRSVLLARAEIQNLIKESLKKHQFGNNSSKSNATGYQRFTVV